jgi:hypothetical protein
MLYEGQVSEESVIGQSQLVKSELVRELVRELLWFSC